MSDKKRTLFLSMTVIVVLIFSAVGPTIAYADGGTTTDTPPTETSTSSDEAATTEATSAPEEVTADATSVPTEATAEPVATSTPEEVTAEATSVPTDATAEPVATEAPEATAEASTDEATAQSTDQAAPTTDASVLDQVPDNTTVTVIDENGQSQPLATQDAAEAIATTSDPIWCPGTQAPTPGLNGCTDKFPSFTELLNALSGNATYSGTGTIYVQQGAYTGGETTIDFNSPSYDLSNIRNSDLTVTGGWNPVDGSTGPTNSSSSTFTGVSILIGATGNPWGGSLTIQNISMNFNPLSATQGNGLTLNSAGSVTLVDVSVMNSPNGAGADVTAGRDVTISKSHFDRNKTAGAIIRAGGNVIIADSSFSNPANGRRQDTGLDITGASVTLANVLADQNRQVGTNITATGPVAISNSSFSFTRIIQGTQFLGYGLQVVTPGSITLASVTGNNNFLWGASLGSATTPAGDIAIIDSVFNANSTASPGFMDDTGLFIKGAGNVALSNVTANDNRLYGAQIETTGFISIVGSVFSNNRGTLTTGGVTTNHGYGLQATSTLASILLDTVTADNNMLFGAQLNAPTGEVTVTDSTFSNTSTGSSADVSGKGLDIVSGGNISLGANLGGPGVVLNNNQTVGANLQSGADIFLDSVQATNNGTDGVNVQAGVCTHLNGGTYSGNGQYGLNLGPSALDLVSNPTFANNGVGDINPASPTTCAPALGATNNTNTAGASNVFASLQFAPKVSSANFLGSQSSNVVFSTHRDGGANTSSGNVSLNTFLAVTRTGTGHVFASIFTGKYIYLYSSSGMQIVAFAPSSKDLAMAGPYRAY